MPHHHLSSHDTHAPDALAAPAKAARRPWRTGRAAALAAVAAAGLSVLAVAAPAQAALPEMYGVEVDAVVETSYTGSESRPDFEHDSALALTTRVRAGFLALIERDATGRIIGASGEDQHAAHTTGTIETREREFAPEWSDWWERATSCTGAGEAKNDEGRTSLRPDPLTPLVGASLVLNLADKLVVDVGCTDTGRNGGAGPRAFTLLSPVPDDVLEAPRGPLAVAFDLPAEATAAGKTIQLFEGPVAGQATYCPPELRERAHMQSCRVTFRGTITFTRDRSAEPRAPAGGGGGGETPRTPGRAPNDDDDLLAPLVPAKQQAKLDRKASSLTFRAACTSGCRGTAAIRVPARGAGRAPGAPAGRAAAAAKLRTLATIRVTVPKSARARAIRVAIPRQARKTLLRSRGAVVALTLKGGGRTTKTTLKLKR